MNNFRGYMVHDAIEHFRTRAFFVPPDMTFDRQELCPGCNKPLHTFAILSSGDRKQKMRYGMCDVCGYTGYMDRPNKEWMVRFYASTWDMHIAKGVAEVATQPRVTDDRKSGRITAVRLAEEFADPAKSFCEIGVGYGSVVRHFKERGFSHVMGVENSEHRARVVENAFAIPVFSGNFESKEISAVLRKRGPIHVFFSNHVLEHVYHPREFVQSIADLQEEGGVVVIGVPNAVGEHAGYGLFYLPHLHQFTHSSLVSLFHDAGYAVVGDQSNDVDLVIAFQKKASRAAVPLQSRPSSEATLNKYLHGLGLEQPLKAGYSVLYWLESNQPHDDARVVWLSSSRWYALAHWYMKKAIDYLRSKILKRFTARHVFLVESYQSPEASLPIEIICHHDILLLMK